MGFSVEAKAAEERLGELAGVVDGKEGSRRAYGGARHVGAWVGEVEEAVSRCNTGVSPGDRAR